MNDDPAPSNAAPQALHGNGVHDSFAEPQDATGGGGGSSSSSSSNRNGGRLPSPARRRKAGLAKKLQFMTHLMMSMDMVVFAELCALYYMDCSFFRLVLRAAAQYLYLTPKSEEFLMLMPANRPHVFAIFGPNAICMLLHLVCALPEAGEAARGYLHGGVIIDFVGQKAPTSKLGLFLLDCFVLALQCFMLSVWAERERLRKLVYPSRQGANSNSQETAAAPGTTGQDLDSEERGMLRDGPATADDTSGIEMQSFAARNEDGGPGEHDASGERYGLLAASSSRDGSSTSLVDVLRSGNAVLADFHVVHAIRTAGNDYQTAAAYPLQLTGYTATLAALAAERRARLEGRARQRQQR
ncbi:DUF1746-domain-containing protein [Pleurostoma richardsiae]|uniref:DUF1746-domain-containing protein n=1 Tax=Pleurostoma richardsiae TaxID=41990 RepID=A0AA38VMP8_9PEZI|nr:DUF1746-domain-containing protein [Pleurostoma richardsiae]